jgi:uncharacterized membrane protein YkgB
MSSHINRLAKLGIFKCDLDYHLARASMVIIFLFYGYQKWCEYVAQALLPHIGNGFLISKMYVPYGIRGDNWLLGALEWLFGALLFAGFWNKKLGILSAAASCVAFLATTMIIPFAASICAASVGAFPALTENASLSIENLVLFAVSVFLLRQDVMRASISATGAPQPGANHVRNNTSP